MMSMNDLQNEFNKSYQFDDLKIKSREYIEGIVGNCKNNFLVEVFEEPNKIDELKKFIIKYSKTYLIINNSIEQNPSFRIVFDFISPISGYPEYVYEIEYNVLGEFLDEFFLEV